MSFWDFLGGGQSENPYSSNKGAFDKYSQEMDAASRAQQAAADRWNPWMNRGNAAGEAGFNAYSRDIANPNAIQDQIAAGFSMSPYQKYMQDLVSKRLNYNATNTGMLGSGAANRALMDELTKSTGQFQNEYINRGLGLYGQALGGMNSIANQGIQAGGLQDQMINEKNQLMQEAAGGRLKGVMSENETNDRNKAANAQRSGNIWGSVLGLAGGVAGNLFGGPAGGAIGSTLGKWFGGGGGGNGGGGMNYGSGGYSPSNYYNGNWSY